MRKVYTQLPSRDEDVVRQVNKVCDRLGVEPPNVKFWQTHVAKYDPVDKTLWLHSAQWIRMFDPDCTGSCFWSAIVMHELAHYLDHVWYEQVGHTPQMYAIQTALVLMEDLPLEEFRKHETKYKPLASKRGRQWAGQALIAALQVKKEEWE